MTDPERAEVEQDLQTMRQERDWVLNQPVVSQEQRLSWLKRTDLGIERLERLLNDHVPQPGGD